MASRKRLKRQSKAEGRSNTSPPGGGQAKWLPPQAARQLTAGESDSRYNESNDERPDEDQADRAR